MLALTPAAKSQKSPAAEVLDISVLVVDDVPLIAETTAAALKPFFRSVVASDPAQALDLQRRDRCEAVIADYRYFGFPSAPEDGVALLRKLDPAPKVALLVSGSTSGKAIAEIGEAGYTPHGQQVVAALLKGRPPEALLKAVRSLHAQSSSVSSAARASVFENLPQPPFSTDSDLDFQRSIVHRVVDNLKSYRELWAQTLETLKTSCNLESWPSWQGMRDRIESELLQLRRLYSDDMLGSLRRTDNALHSLRQRVAFIDPVDLEPAAGLSASVAELARKELFALQRRHVDFERLVQGCYREFSDFAQESFTLGKLAPKLFGARILEDIYALEPGAAAQIKIRDPEHGVSRFLAALKECLDAHGGHISIASYRAPQWVLYANKAAPIIVPDKWGSWLELQVRFPCAYADNKPNSFYLGALRDHFVTLRENVHVAAAEFDPDEEPCSAFKFSVRVTEKDFQAVAEKAARQEKICLKSEETLRGRRKNLHAFQIDWAGPPLVVLGAEPKRLLDAGDFTLGEFQGTWILSFEEDGHMQADAQYGGYLMRSLGASEEDAINSAIETLRGRVSEGICYLDPKTDQRSLHQRLEVRQIVDLLLGGRIDLDRHFAGRDIPFSLMF